MPFLRKYPLLGLELIVPLILLPVKIFFIEVDALIDILEAVLIKPIELK
jgi:hypothetical protein